MIWPFLIPITGIIAATLMVIGLPIARAYARRLEGGAQIPPELSARLAHMEQAIDTIAVEVERISEAQRFTTRLLAERPPELTRTAALSAYPQQEPVP